MSPSLQALREPGKGGRDAKTESKRVYQSRHYNAQIQSISLKMAAQHNLSLLY